MYQSSAIETQKSSQILKEFIQINGALLSNNENHIDLGIQNLLKAMGEVGRTYKFPKVDSDFLKFLFYQ